VIIDALFDEECEEYFSWVKENHPDQYKEITTEYEELE
jgi:hypothetical protein